MTAPDDLVEVNVPAEQVRVGDLLVIDTVDHHVEQVIPDAVPDFVYAFVPEQVPLPRGHLVPVRRPRSQTSLATPPSPIDPEEYAAVRDLALALADAAPATQVRKHADRVRTRLQPDEPAPTPPAPSPAPAPPTSPTPTGTPPPAPVPPTRLDATPPTEPAKGKAKA